MHVWQRVWKNYWDRGRPARNERVARTFRTTQPCLVMSVGGLDARDPGTRNDFFHRAAYLRFTIQDLRYAPWKKPHVYHSLPGKLFT